jgi:crotonobetainyl-CoA:carnitine CoA-transferase CaiB-like acyl-CoA transferase
MWNRNKRSIALDMSYPEARQIALKLTAISDVVIENFSPRVMSNWGLHYEKLKAVKPDLVMVSMSGMGQTGPWNDYVAFGPTIQAFSGLTSLTSFDEDNPMGLGHAYADCVAALYAVLAILAALEYRDKTGTGQYIDLSEYEAMCSLLGPLLLDISAHRENVLPQGNHADYMPAAPYGCYQCSGTDKWCTIAVCNEREWEALCKTMGNPQWARDERFSSLEKRKDHSAELDELLGQWTLAHEAEELMHLLQEAGVPAGKVQNAEDLARDPQLRARGYFVNLEHPVLGNTVSDLGPIQFRTTPIPEWKAAPLLGQDNRSVYIDLLGLSEGEVSSYLERGIIR